MFIKSVAYCHTTVFIAEFVGNKLKHSIGLSFIFWAERTPREKTHTHTLTVLVESTEDPGCILEDKRQSHAHCNTPVYNSEERYTEMEDGKNKKATSGYLICRHSETKHDLMNWKWYHPHRNTAANTTEARGEHCMETKATSA